MVVKASALKWKRISYSVCERREINLTSFHNSPVMNEAVRKRNIKVTYVRISENDHFNSRGEKYSMFNYDWAESRFKNSNSRSEIGETPPWSLHNCDVHIPLIWSFPCLTLNNDVLRLHSSKVCTVFIYIGKCTRHHPVCHVLQITDKDSSCDCIAFHRSCHQGKKTVIPGAIVERWCKVMTPERGSVSRPFTPTRLMPQTWHLWLMMGDFLLSRSISTWLYYVFYIWPDSSCSG